MTAETPTPTEAGSGEREVAVGTCALCGQEMIRTADDCWHPWDVAVACPPEPGRMSDSRENFHAWQEFHAAGLRPGRPGREHFRESA